MVCKSIKSSVATKDHKRRSVINGQVNHTPTPISGIRYYQPAAEAVLSRKDSELNIPCGDIPLPLLQADYDVLAEAPPSFDAVGRGLYAALRANPDCAFAARYAEILNEGYPHFVAEMASHIVMLDKKDVDVSYLERKITYLKIMALIDPGNQQLQREIGVALMERGLSLSSLTRTTVTLYRAEAFLRRAVAMSPEDTAARHSLGEVCYILGKYDDAVASWRAVLDDLQETESGAVGRRIDAITNGMVTRVPTVDYLEAIGVAFDYFQQENHSEAAAILQDVLDDTTFRKEFPLPGVHHVLGACYRQLGMLSLARDNYHEALRLDPAYKEAETALASL